MNTVILIDPKAIVGRIGTINESQIGLPNGHPSDDPNVSGSMTAWYIIPGSHYKEGEIYLLSAGVLHRMRTHNGDKTVVEVHHSADTSESAVLSYYSEVFGVVRSYVETEVSDLLLPRGILDDLNELAVQYGHVYLIRVPAIGLGKLSLVIGRDFAPMLVRKPAAIGKVAGHRPKQKHVSKPNTPK